jgi:FkbM family methyltransferase
MLIPARKISKLLQIHPQGVVHIGAHHAEEFTDYHQFHWGRVLWVEAIPENIEVIKSKIEGSGDLVIQALAWSESNLDLKFNITNNGQSSSALNLGTHAFHYPEIKVAKTVELLTSTMDQIIPLDFKFDLVAIDVQGAELPVLIGFNSKLNEAKYIYCEVNRELLYENCTLVAELDKWLAERGFTRLISAWTKEGWGDAIYVKTNSVTRALHFRKFLLTIFLRLSGFTK